MAIPIVKIITNKQTSEGFIGLFVLRNNYFDFTGLIPNLRETLYGINIGYRKDIEKSILKTK